MLTSTTPYNRPLGDGLVLKSITDKSDAERVIAFDAQIFGQGTAAFASDLILDHPDTRPEHWLYIEDETSKQIVSSLCLIPWQWRYEDVTLKSGEVGIVGTLESHRNRGLVRLLMARHRELLCEGDFDFSHIQGIPYFYRQFGYEYAMPLDVHWNLELHSLPDKPASTAYNFRLATQQDIPVLMGLYEQAAKGLQISTVRDEHIWNYLLEHAFTSDVGAETWLISDAAGQPTAYFRIPSHGFGSGLIVNETSRLNDETAQALLVHLKGIAQERSKPNIRLDLPDSNDLVRVAAGFNAHNDGCYCWQIHLVDVARLLRKLAPVLERRIAASLFAGMTRTLCLNLYKEAFELHFEQGKLQAVKSIGFTDEWGIKIPPLFLAPLILGYRSHKQLREMYADVSINREYHHLIDVLFPKLESFLFTIF
jgi:predicted acetyltransferase